MDYIYFWLAKFVAESIVFSLFFAWVFALIAFICARNLVRSWLCNHAKYRETQACDAICCNCGKNLGFIGIVKERRKRK